MPADFNDDGLLDYLRANETVVEAFCNSGTGWEESAAMATVLSSLGVNFSTADGDATGVVLGDVDGDGISDFLKAKEGETRQLWLSSSMRSGLLVRSTSPLGEVNEIEWAMSVSFDNRYFDTSLGVELNGLPGPMPVATALVRHDLSLIHI